MDHQDRPDFEGILTNLVGIDRVNNLVMLVFEQAEGGCRVSQNMVLKRLIPELKAMDRPAMFEVGQGYEATVKSILSHMSNGLLTPEEGGKILTAMACAERAGEKLLPQQATLEIIGGIDPAVIPSNEVEVTE